MIFSCLGKVVRVKAREMFDTFSQFLIILSLQVQLIQGLINLLGVSLLDNSQERLN